MRASAPPTRRWGRAAETAAYLAVVYALSWPLLASLHDVAHGEVLVRLGMCVPGAVALVLVWSLRREGLATLRVGVGRPRAWMVALLAPPALMASVLCSMAVLRRGHSPDLGWSLPLVGPVRGAAAIAAVFAFHVVLTSSYLIAAVAERFVPRARGLRFVMRAIAWSVPLFVGQVPGDVGEELGWRGYLLRRWEDRPRAAVLISGLAWAAFHVPLLPALATDTPARLRMLLCIALAAVPMAALYRYAGSFWPCAVAHSGVNLWSDLLLGDGRSDTQWSGLFGWPALVLFAAVACLTFKPATRPA